MSHSGECLFRRPTFEGGKAILLRLGWRTIHASSEVLTSEIPYNRHVDIRYDSMMVC